MHSFIQQIFIGIFLGPRCLETQNPLGKSSILRVHIHVKEIEWNVVPVTTDLHSMLVDQQEEATTATGGSKKAW
jgi:hypothetical protein